MVIQHARSDTGRIGGKLRERGYALDVRCPLAGDALPERLEDYTGVVVFGGTMSANDDRTLPGIRAQLDWIPGALETEKPFLGVCLGAQLLARVLGARVDRHPEGLNEIGYYPIRPTAAGEELFGDALHVYHWHEEGFDLPESAALLAEGERFPNQAYRYGRHAYGIQFHPEATREMIQQWMAESAERLSRPGAQPPDQQISGHARHDASLERWLDGFLARWLDE